MCYLDKIHSISWNRNGILVGNVMKRETQLFAKRCRVCVRNVYKCTCTRSLRTCVLVFWANDIERYPSSEGKIEIKYGGLGIREMLRSRVCCTVCCVSSRFLILWNEKIHINSFCNTTSLWVFEKIFQTKLFGGANRLCIKYSVDKCWSYSENCAT